MGFLSAVLYGTVSVAILETFTGREPLETFFFLVLYQISWS